MYFAIFIAGNSSNLMRTKIVCSREFCVRFLQAHTSDCVESKLWMAVDGM